MNAEKGDLVRIIEHSDNTYIGKYYEIGDVFEVKERLDSDGVKIIVGSKSLYLFDNEYEIYRKAVEEDSAELQDICQTEQASRIRKSGEFLTELLIRKNHDYGDSFSQQYAKYGALSALIRMDDKMRRLETLISGERAQIDESISDTLLDLAGYALLAYAEGLKRGES